METAAARSLAPAAARPGIRRKLATAAVMTGLVVSAFEGTVVTSAMPAVARELGGLSLYPWVFTAFLVASTLAVPLSGKLADAVGRRPVFTAGMALFLVGSALCGMAHSMAALVAFRVVQGLGAGVVAPIGTTVSGDLYTLEERARIQGVFTGAWGLANVAGPLIGGWIVMHASWRWVFLVNLPLGALAVLLLLVSYVDPPRRTRGRIDWTSVTFAAVALAAVVLAVERDLAVGPIARSGLVAAAVISALGFARRQSRIANPLVEPAHVRDPVVRAGVLGSIFVGAVIYVPSAYVPLWVVHEAHGDALHAGLALVPTLAGWAVGSTVGVRVMVRWGMRASSLGGFLLSSAGATCLALIAAHGGPHALPLAMAALFAVGLGLGPAANAFLLGAQTRAGWHSRGVVTSLVHAARALGGSLAVAALGAVGDGPGAGTMRFAGLAVITWAAAWFTSRAAPSGQSALARDPGDLHGTPVGADH